MSGRIAHGGFGAVLGSALFLFPALSAADDPSPSKDKPAAAKVPDWSGYVDVTTLVGEVVKVDAKRLVLRVTWLEPQVQGRFNPNDRNPNNRRPRVTVKEREREFKLEFVPETLVRTKLLPPKLDEKGRRVNYTPQEVAELRSPRGAPYYAASKPDLTPGAVVEVSVVRDKTIPAAQVTENEWRVKYAVVLAKDADDKKPDPKKN